MNSFVKSRQIVSQYLEDVKPYLLEDKDDTEDFPERVLMDAVLFAPQYGELTIDQAAGAIAGALIISGAFAQGITVQGKALLSFEKTIIAQTVHFLNALKREEQFIPVLKATDYWTGNHDGTFPLALPDNEDIGVFYRLDETRKLFAPIRAVSIEDSIEVDPNRDLQINVIREIKLYGFNQYFTTIIPLTTTIR